MQEILFDFISKYITLTNEEKNALLSLDLFHSIKKGTTLLEEGQKTQNSSKMEMKRQQHFILN
jgi:hypothetical protein